VSDCAAIKKHLAAFFDGELEGPAADEVAAHLDECARCRARLEDLESIDAPLRAIDPPPVAAGEWSKCWGVIEAAIAAEPAESPSVLPVSPAARSSDQERAARLIRWLIPLAAAASIALASYSAVVLSAHESARAEAQDREVALAGLLPGGAE
jgi:anti-sigma factor RsiW